MHNSTLVTIFAESLLSLWLQCILFPLRGAASTPLKPGRVPLGHEASPSCAQIRLSPSSN
jgi:hypothetical protein